MSTRSVSSCTTRATPRAGRWVRRRRPPRTASTGCMKPVTGWRPSWSPGGPGELLELNAAVLGTVKRTLRGDGPRRAGPSPAPARPPSARARSGDPTGEPPRPHPRRPNRTPTRRPSCCSAHVPLQASALRTTPVVERPSAPGGRGAERPGGRGAERPGGRGAEERGVSKPRARAHKRGGFETPALAGSGASSTTDRGSQHGPLSGTRTQPGSSPWWLRSRGTRRLETTSFARRHRPDPVVVGWVCLGVVVVGGTRVVGRGG